MAVGQSFQLQAPGPVRGVARGGAAGGPWLHRACGLPGTREGVPYPQSLQEVGGTLGLSSLPREGLASSRGPWGPEPGCSLMQHSGQCLASPVLLYEVTDGMGTRAGSVLGKADWET